METPFLSLQPFPNPLPLPAYVPASSQAHVPHTHSCSWQGGEWLTSQPRSFLLPASLAVYPHSPSVDSSGLTGCLSAVLCDLDHSPLHSIFHTWSETLFQRLISAPDTTLLRSMWNKVHTPRQDLEGLFQPGFSLPLASSPSGLCSHCSPCFAWPPLSSACSASAQLLTSSSNAILFLPPALYSVPLLPLFIFL